MGLMLIALIDYKCLEDTYYYGEFNLHKLPYDFQEHVMKLIKTRLYEAI